MSGGKRGMCVKSVEGGTGPHAGYKMSSPEGHVTSFGGAGRTRAQQGERGR